MNDTMVTDAEKTIAPKRLVEELTKSRHALLTELKEQRRWPEEDDLETELSQDADLRVAHRR